MAEQPAPVSRKKKIATIVWSVGIVVLILGCLGALATPKFGGFGARCKSLQSEAKTNLSGIFNAEKAFHGEYGFYTTDLVALNWTPDGAPHYVYGFAAPSTVTKDEQIADLDPTRRTTLDPRVIGPNRYAVVKMQPLDGRAFTDEDVQRLAPAATATSNAFLAFAIGDIDDDRKEEKFDVWSIDQNRQLQWLANDCAD